MKTKQLLLGAISVAAAIVASNSQAQSLDTYLIGFDPTLQVVGTLSNNPIGEEYTSGVMNFRDDTNSSFFDAFCVEPTVGMSFGDSPTYDIQDINLLPNADLVARLVGGYLASSMTNEDAAAVHWAIWEVTTEAPSNSYSLLDGQVWVQSPNEATALLANNYLTNINTYAPADLTYLVSGTAQNVVTWNVVPEPSSVGLMALSALCFLRRKR